jgi:hypothetical protein
MRSGVHADAGGHRRRRLAHLFVVPASTEADDAESLPVLLGSPGAMSAPVEEGGIAMPIELLSPEPAAPAEDGESASEPTETAWTSDAVLAQARALARSLDSQHATTYTGMRDARWLQSVDLGAALLTAHAAYRLHHARGRGRRQHAAEVHTLLDEANAANLVAALALMLVLGRILDRSPRED